MRISSGLHSFGRRLTIGNPTSADTGLYVCEATLSGSTFDAATAKAFLSIIGNAGRQTAHSPWGAAHTVLPQKQPGNIRASPAPFVTQKMRVKWRLPSRFTPFFFFQEYKPARPKALMF